MKPVASTLESRRREAIAHCATGVARANPHCRADVMARWKAVVDLGPDPSAEAIVAAQTALGRTTDLMLTISCHACDRQVERVVDVGADPDRAVSLCRACLVEALAVLDGAE